MAVQAVFFEAYMSQKSERYQRLICCIIEVKWRCGCASKLVKSICTHVQSFNPNRVEYLW